MTSRCNIETKSTNRKKRFILKENKLMKTGEQYADNKPLVNKHAF